MAIDYTAVQIENINLNVSGVDEVMQNLRVLYTTPVGTVPFDREFGININVLDAPLQMAKGRIMVEYMEKTKRFEPRADVEEVTFSGDPINGKLIPKVVVHIDLEAE